MSESSILCDLAELLRWSDDSLLDAIDAIALEAVTSELGAALGRLSQNDEASASSILDSLQGLPDDAVGRLVTAPELYFRLQDRVRPADIAEFLIDSVDAERRVAGIGSPGTAAVWTAVGDWYFPPGASRIDLAPDADPLVWVPNAAHRAPTLGNGVPVDFASPFRRGPLPDVSGDDAELSVAERRTIMAKLDAAVAAAADACPGAARFVARLSRVIVPRKDYATDRRYRSTSTRISPGRPVLRNVDLPEATTEEIIDGLVHETIHCVIDLLELREPLVLDRALRTSVVKSPWTGRELDLDTYLQACFIWYGLWNTWMQALDSAALDDRSVVRYLAACGYGFITSDAVGPLVPLASSLAPSLLGQLQRVQTQVRQESHLIERALAMARSEL